MEKDYFRIVVFRITRIITLKYYTPLMVDWQRFCIRVENICFGSSGVVAFKLNFRFTLRHGITACEICQKLPIIYIKIVKCVVYSNEKYVIILISNLIFK